MAHPEPAPGRQLKIGVTFLAWLNIYQNLKQAVQDVIAPEIQQLRGDIKAQNGEIKALSVEIGALRQRMDGFEKRIDLFENRMDQRFDAVDRRFDAIDREWPRALDIYTRLAALEARLEKR
jgi:hypothetical protein